MSDKLISLESALKEIRRFKGYIDDDMIERFFIAFKRLPFVELPIPAVPQEMSAVEWLMTTSKICASHRCSQCPLYDVPCIGEYVDSAFTVDEAKEAVAIVEKWAREHPERSDE